MTLEPAVTASLESPTYFPAGGVTLFGVHTRPQVDRSDLGAVLFPGGGSISTNRNRLSVHLARHLAALGYHVLRFDYHGTGESAGVLARAPRVDEPYLVDAGAAAGWIRSRGADRLVLIGSCFGARTALSFAPTLPGVQTVVLVSPPLRDLAMDQEVGTRLALRVGGWEAVVRALRLRAVLGVLDPARRRTYRQFIRVKAHLLSRRLARVVLRRAVVEDYWVSRQLLGPIQALARQGVPVLFIFGTEDHHYHDFLLARTGRLGRALEAAPNTEVRVIEGLVHGYTRVDMQDRIARTILEWLGRHVAAPDPVRA